MPLKQYISAGALFAAMLSAAHAVSGPNTDWPRFAQNSFWYRRIPRDVPLSPKSPDYVQEFLRQLTFYRGDVGINTTAYSSPVYIVEYPALAVSVTPWDCHHSGYIDRRLAEQWRDVPVPSYAAPADGTDSEMTIFQPSTDTMWEFWRARHAGSGWQACWGGRMDHVSQNPGIWQRRFGATATGLPFAGGELTVAELQRGDIDHVIGIAMVEVASWQRYSWPANRSDGYNPEHEPDRIPEGQRFRLDPAVDVDALPIHPIAKAIARAAQTYGFVVWDKAGGISIRAENPKDFTQRGLPNPYPALWNGTPAYKILSGIPWNRLEFLPANFGRP